MRLKRLPHYWPFARGILCPLLFLWCKSEETVEQTLKRPVICDSMTLMWHHSNILEQWFLNYQNVIASIMMTSSNGNIFRVTGHLWEEFTGPGEFPAQRPVKRSFDVSLICVWISVWVKNSEAVENRHSDFLTCVFRLYGVIEIVMAFSMRSLRLVWLLVWGHWDWFGSSVININSNINTFVIHAISYVPKHHVNMSQWRAILYQIKQKGHILYILEFSMKSQKTHFLISILSWMRGVLSITQLHELWYN